MAGCPNYVRVKLHNTLGFPQFCVIVCSNHNTSCKYQLEQAKKRRPRDSRLKVCAQLSSAATASTTNYDK